MLLKGNNIYIKLLSPDDVSETYCSWLADTDINKYLESKWKPYSITDLQEFVRLTNNGLDNFLFGIYENNEDLHIGNIKIGPINHFHKFADIGLLIGNKKFWGKGIGAQAIYLISEFAFKHLNLNKVTASMYANNIASMKAFEKNKFKLLGKYRNHCFNDGQYIDVFLYELIHIDFEI